MSAETTDAQYHAILARCRQLFAQKTQDYGTAWRILRLPSLTDQIYIKALRIRSIQEKGSQQVADDIPSEFVGIINYCALALVQEALPEDAPTDLPATEAIRRYNAATEEAFALMQRKNHDYGEAWRALRISSITDLILQKILRIKQIEDAQGATLVSEGVRAGYLDMLNYAAFALILLEEQDSRSSDLPQQPE